MIPIVAPIHTSTGLPLAARVAVASMVLSPSSATNIAAAIDSAIRGVRHDDALVAHPIGRRPSASLTRVSANRRPIGLPVVLVAAHPDRPDGEPDEQHAAADEIALVGNVAPRSPPITTDRSMLAM